MFSVRVPWIGAAYAAMFKRCPGVFAAPQSAGEERR